MSPTNYFAGAAFGGPEWLRWFVLAFIMLGVALGAVFFAARAERDPGIYSPRVAWLRAWLYYCFVTVFSWVTGVLGVVVQQPLVDAARFDDPLWLGLLVLCWVVAFWGYGYWWPRGTVTHGRRLYLVPAAVHGVMWGWCAGLLYLSIYAVLEQFGFPGWVNGLLLIAILSVYSLNYQVGWWDIHVSPPHNLLATNNGKVALAHQPFLLATLAFFILYGAASMYVLLTVFALTCSAVAMRFPPFWLPDGGVVSRQTAMGE